MHVIVDCIGLPLSIFFFAFSLSFLLPLFLFPYPHFILQRVISNCHSLFIKQIGSSGRRQASGKAKELKILCGFLLDIHLPFGQGLHSFRAARDSRRLLLVSLNSTGTFSSPCFFKNIYNNYVDFVLQRWVLNHGAFHTLGKHSAPELDQPAPLFAADVVN